MNIKTIKYKKVCPYCGSTSVSSIIHSDGMLSSTKHKCGSCNEEYLVSESYDADTDYGKLVEQAIKTLIKNGVNKDDIVIIGGDNYDE